MRLFVAIVPPAAVLDDLAGRLRPLRAAWPGLRWTAPETWHLTLAFLGETDERVLPDLEARLARGARRHQPLELAVRGAGTFPGPAKAEVLWAGLRVTSADQDAHPARRPARGKPLDALAATVAAGARRAGARGAGASLRFRPHITLARCRVPADLGALAAELADLAGPAWLAGDIQLIRSHLPGGSGQVPGSRPRYEALASWPLGRGQPEDAG